MFSGKSTELIRRIHRYRHAKLDCLVVKYLFDTRHSEEMLSTHDKVFVEAMPVQTLAEVRPFLNEYDVIGIDEGQFYPDVRIDRELLTFVGGNNARSCNILF
ncbi:pre-mRNA 3' end processing protein [Phytophthora nicotianae]|uniref:Thymidine kinase n=1 Tax=Phytophthora nicotianae TaxID=4792 RepID=A0A0W8DNE7_PHYNI|nr:pre-mRNA 3' end processing protein [Phytophthora nicotianae]